MPEPTTRAPADRRAAVLDSALATFARFGYRKTSMEEVARAARISRPGLYFLFSSKEELFRAAAARALEGDLAEAERALGERDRSLADRLLDAFDHWAGRYLGPLARDVAAVLDDNPELLGELARSAPDRFAALVTDALAAGAEPGDRTPEHLAQTLISTSIGIKHQVDDRAGYRERLAIAIGLLPR